MRAQFDKTWNSTYHLRLLPTVKPAITINVPQNQATLLQSGRGVVFADINIGWWAAQISNLEANADPTHLPIYLTNDVMLYTNHNPGNCCVIGFHGNKATGNGGGRDKSQGNAEVQTFAWASYVSPGLYSRPSGGTDWALQDIHALFLPWFMRYPANATGSEPNQSGSGGRYTFMGDLNPFPGFRAPATGC